MRGLWGNFWFRTSVVMMAGAIIICGFHYTIAKVGLSLTGKAILPILVWLGTEVYIWRNGRSAVPLLSYILFMIGCELSLIPLSGLAFSSAVAAYGGHLGRATTLGLITLGLSSLAGFIPALLYGYIWQTWLHKPDRLSEITKQF